MIKPNESGVSPRQDILGVLVVLPLIVWEVYLVWFGGLVRSVEASPSFLPYFAFFGALLAAWCVIDLECFPKWTGLNRKTRVWFAISADLWSAGLILLWLEPRLAEVIVVSFLVIADLTIFLTVRDLLHRALSGVRY